jgi:hypothetical protein
MSANWYNGISNGNCKCNYCKKKWKEKHSGEIPNNFNDTAYAAFMRESVRDLLVRTNLIIKELRPKSSFSVFHMTDGKGIVNSVTIESRTDFKEPHTWWPYDASCAVNQELNAFPNQVPFATVVNFIDFKYRFASHRPGELTTRVYQNIANGGPVAFYMVGAPAQQNQEALNKVKKVFAWHKAKEFIYSKSINAAEVLLIRSKNLNEHFKGMIRLLSEEHVPYKIVSSLENISPVDYPLCVSTNGSIDGLVKFMESGGNLLLAGLVPPKLDNFEAPIKKWSKEELSSSYWVQSHKENEVIENLYFQGPLLQFKDDSTSEIKLRLPGIHSPAELVKTSPEITNIPGVIKKSIGKGKLIYFPWEITSHYFRHSTSGYKQLFADCFDSLSLDGRKIYTDASGLVEFTLLKKTNKNEVLMNLINLSPRLPALNSQAIHFQDIKIRIKGEYRTAELVSSEKSLDISFDGSYTYFEVDQLDEFETIILK